MSVARQIRQIVDKEGDSFTAHVCVGIPSASLMLMMVQFHVSYTLCVGLASASVSASPTHVP
jgi:hypothetical protein